MIIEVFGERETLKPQFSKESMEHARQLSYKRWAKLSHRNLFVQRRRVQRQSISCCRRAPFPETSEGCRRCHCKHPHPVDHRRTSDLLLNGLPFLMRISEYTWPDQPEERQLSTLRRFRHRLQFLPNLRPTILGRDSMSLANRLAVCSR